MSHPFMQRTEPLAAFGAWLREGKHALLLALGDSNTCNTGFTRGAKQWPELLHSELRDRYQTQKILLVNSGISGDTVHNALQRWHTDVARFMPTLAIVCFGSNDANKLDDAEFAEGLAEIVDRLQALSCGVLLRTPTPIMEFKPEPGHIWKEDRKLKRRVEQILELAARRELPCVDVYAHWCALEAAGELRMPELMTDAVHTNAAGHAMVFRSLAPAFGLPPVLAWERVGQQNV